MSRSKRYILQCKGSSYDGEGGETVNGIKYNSYELHIPSPLGRRY